MEENEDEELEEKKEIKFYMNVSEQALLDPLILSEQHLSQQLKQVQMGVCEKLVWRAAETKQHFRLLWKMEAHILKQLFPFFVEVCLHNFKFINLKNFYFFILLALEGR